MDITADADPRRTATPTTESVARPQAAPLPGQSHRLRVDEKTALERAKQRGPSARVVEVEQAPQRVLFAQSKLAVSAGRQGAGWNALVPGDAPAALCGATFSVELDGQRLVLSRAESSAQGFRDSIGLGQGLRQVWRANGARVETELRVYEGWGVFTLGGRIANETRKDCASADVNDLELDANGGWSVGWWPRRRRPSSFKTAPC